MANKIWQQAATTRHRLGMMKGMRTIGLGFNCDEDYLRGLVEQGKVTRSQGKLEGRIMGLIMDTKIGDQRNSLRELKSQQGKVRGEMVNLFGQRTMAYRRSLRRLKRVGKAEEKHQSQRLGAKFDHLRIKHSKSLKEREMS